MLVSILNVNVNIDMHIDIERGPKKFFPTPGGSCSRMCVWYHGVNARGGGLGVSLRIFNAGWKNSTLNVVCDVTWRVEIKLSSSIR